MKGNEKVLEVLNDLLADELTAINQYMVHSEMCDNWGYARLHEVVERRAIVEMKHAEKLISRILFLEGLPIVSVLKAIHIGATVDQQLANDLDAEHDAVRKYNNAVKITTTHEDGGTREMLEHILEDEEAHVDWLEAQRDQIGQMGIPHYLSQQVKKEG